MIPYMYEIRRSSEALGKKVSVGVQIVALHCRVLYAKGYTNVTWTTTIQYCIIRITMQQSLVLLCC